MEAVARQGIFAPQDLDPTHFRHDNDGASHPAVRAGAAQDRIEVVAERHFETHRAAMALASPNVRVARHVAIASCSDHFNARCLVKQTRVSDLNTNKIRAGQSFKNSRVM
jgi:hypothetical protein